MKKHFWRLNTILTTTVLFACAGILLVQPVAAQNFNPKTPASQNFFSTNEECDGVTKPGGIIGAIIEGGFTLMLSENGTYSKVECVRQESIRAGDSPDQTRAKVENYIISATKSPSLLNIASNTNIALLEQRPASGIRFVEGQIYALENLGRVSAQEDPFGYYPGRGEDLLRPIQAFWGWSVNFVFGFMIVIILFVALAIILGDKFPLAKVTLTNAIPSIALALILVPLSYSITGLFIDFITVGTNVAHGFIVGRGSPGEAIYLGAIGQENSLQLQSPLLNPCGNFISVPGATDEAECENRGLYVDDPRVNVFNIRDRIDISQGATLAADAFTDSLGQNNPLLILFNVIGGLIKLLPGDENGFGNNAWFGNLLNIIIGIATLWTSLKILWELLKKYFVLTILPIFSPFVFVTIALPGTGSKQIEKYLRSLAAASIFFITVYAMFLLTMLFTSTAFHAQFPSASFSTYVPPMTGLESLLAGVAETAGGAGINSLIFTLIGLMIFFAIPSVLKNIDEKVGGGAFTLPKFVTDAGKEFRSSFKVGRTAPFIAGGNTIGAAKSGFELGLSAKNTLKNLPTTLQRRSENKRGLDENTPGTIKNRKKIELENKYAAALKDLNDGKKNLAIADQTNDPALRRRALNQIDQANKERDKVQGEAKSFGISLSGASTEEKDKVSISLNLEANPKLSSELIRMSDTNIVISKLKVGTDTNQTSNPFYNAVTPILIGSIKLEAQNAFFVNNESVFIKPDSKSEISFKSWGQRFLTPPNNNTVTTVQIPVTIGFTGIQPPPPRPQKPTPLAALSFEIFIDESTAKVEGSKYSANLFLMPSHTGCNLYLAELNSAELTEKFEIYIKNSQGKIVAKTKSIQLRLSAVGKLTSPF